MIRFFKKVSGKERKGPRENARVWLAILCLVCLSSCATLPEYARPRFHTDVAKGKPDDPGFGYRQLTIDDFQAVSPPDRQQPEGAIRAQSCISIRPSKNTKMSVSRASYQGTLVYAGSFLQVEYEAIFVPSCSWWKPDLQPQLKGYVLQHEQVHFAISELTARKITKEMELQANTIISFGSTVGEVQQDLLQKLQVQAHVRIEDDLEIHTDFDEDTSLFHDPDVQQDWFNKVKEQLVVGIAAH